MSCRGAGGTQQWSPGPATISLPKQHYLAGDVIRQVSFSPINIIQPGRGKKTAGYHRSLGRNLECACFPFAHIYPGDTW